MKPNVKRFLTALAAFAIGAAIMRMWNREEPVPEIQAPPAQARIEAPAGVPRLLPARAATPEHPFQSWERLLAEDGTPVEDRAALADVVTNFLQGTLSGPRPPLGTNEEITSALTDSSISGEALIPPNHPAIISGQLVDRWGSPWFFHQLAADVIEVRSAGPDRKLFTPDDVTK